ncbi:hypothetical protein ACLRGI_17140 [Paenarthrobacter nitroguajacolicus]|uniref:hypothetical protein n=1 Tax=Paenarthrobacter nitroguajacolicus TaxID=211146 RepID=UPI003AE39704
MAKWLSRLFRVRAAPYAVGILASTGSTYVLFLVFSLVSPPDSLGLFALWGGIVAIFIQFIDGISAQRIAQGHQDLSTISPLTHGSVNFLNLSRFGVVVIVGLLTSLMAFIADPAMTIGVFVMLTGQGAYALCVSTRVYGPPESLLRLQLFNCLVYLLVSAGCFLLPEAPSGNLLMILSGVASLAAALPSLIRDFIDRLRMDLPLTKELKQLYLGQSWKHLGSLAAYQAVNAFGGAVDTLLTALGGLRTAAEYQVVRRPMLALGSLNVAVGQHALNRYAQGSTKGWPMALARLTPVLIAWPLLGLAGLAVVRWITPDDYDVSILAGILLATSFALSAFLQITGTIILVRSHTFALFVSSLGRILVLVLVAYVAVPSLGVVGIGIAVVLANVFLLAAHLCLLVFGERGNGRHRKGSSRL